MVPAAGAGAGANRSQPSTKGVQAGAKCCTPGRRNLLTLRRSLWLRLLALRHRGAVERLLCPQLGLDVLQLGIQVGVRLREQIGARPSGGIQSRSLDGWELRVGGPALWRR